MKVVTAGIFRAPMALTRKKTKIEPEDHPARCPFEGLAPGMIFST